MDFQSYVLIFLLIIMFITDIAVEKHKISRKLSIFIYVAIALIVIYLKVYLK